MEDRARILAQMSGEPGRAEEGAQTNNSVLRRRNFTPIHSDRGLSPRFGINIEPAPGVKPQARALPKASEVEQISRGTVTPSSLHNSTTPPSWRLSPQKDKSSVYSIGRLFRHGAYVAAIKQNCALGQHSI